MTGKTGRRRRAGTAGRATRFGLRALALMMFASALLSACGQTGPLVLPSETTMEDDDDDESDRER